MHACYISCIFIYLHYKCLSIRKPYKTIGVTSHFLVLGVSYRVSPSMDTVGEQAGSPTLTVGKSKKTKQGRGKEIFNGRGYMC